MFSLSLSSIPDIIYSRLPGQTFKRLFVNMYSKYSQLYALDKMVTYSELLPDGTVYLELDDGTKFYGDHDNEAPEKDVSHAVIIKLDKLSKLETSRKVLGVLCSQYVKADYEKYYKPQKGDIIVDAGAHFGSFTIKAARAVGSEGRVISIEPEPKNLKSLSKNIEANGLQNVSVVPKGIWKSKGKLKLNISRKRSTGHSFYTDKQFGTEDTIEFVEVEVDTLDNIIRQSGVGQVDFIKMDIEGAEIEAIRGMDETLSGNVKLAFEGCHIIAGKRTYQIVIPWLNKMGFEVRRDGRIVYAWKRV